MKAKVYAFADEASPRISEQIDAMKRNGLDGLEIRGVDGQNIVQITVQKVKEVKHLLDEHGLAVWSIGSPIGKIGIEEDFAPHYDAFKHLLEVADILDCRNIRLFSFYIPDGRMADDFTSEVIHRMGLFLEAAGSDFCLCHENEKGIYGEDPEHCEKLLRTFPTLKGIFDPANFIQSGVDTLKAWELLKEYTYYMHIKDAVADGTVVPAGRGDGRLEQIVTSFYECGGRHFTIEPHLTLFDGLAQLERTNKTEMPPFTYPDADTAFDAACTAFRDLLRTIDA